MANTSRCRQGMHLHAALRLRLVLAGFEAVAGRQVGRHLDHRHATGLQPSEQPGEECMDHRRRVVLQDDHGIHQVHPGQFRDTVDGFEEMRGRVGGPAKGEGRARHGQVTGRHVHGFDMAELLRQGQREPAHAAAEVHDPSQARGVDAVARQRPPQRCDIASAGRIELLERVADAVRPEVIRRHHGPVRLFLSQRMPALLHAREEPYAHVVVHAALHELRRFVPRHRMHDGKARLGPRFVRLDELVAHGPCRRLRSQLLQRSRGVRFAVKDEAIGPAGRLAPVIGRRPRLPRGIAVRGKAIATDAAEQILAANRIVGDLRERSAIGRLGSAQEPMRPHHRFLAGVALLRQMPRPPAIETGNAQARRQGMDDGLEAHVAAILPCRRLRPGRDCPGRYAGVHCERPAHRSPPT